MRSIVTFAICGLLTGCGAAQPTPGTDQQPLASAAPSAGLPRGPTHLDRAQLLTPLKEAHDDLMAKKYAEAIARLKKADATSGKNAYDQHLINDMLAFAYIRTNNYGDAEKAMGAEIDDGFTPPADQPQKVRALAALNYQLKNYDRAIAYGQRAIKGGYSNEETPRIVGQAYYLKGDWKGTMAFEGNLVSAAIKRGETPSKESLQLIYSACIKDHESECATRALEQLKRYYPGTDPMAPQRPAGTLLAYFFGPPQDVEAQKPPSAAK